MSAVSPSSAAPAAAAAAAAAAEQPTNQTQQKTTNTALKILSSFGEFIKNQGRSLWNNTIGVIVSGVLGCVKFVFQSVFGSAKKVEAVT